MSTPEQLFADLLAARPANPFVTYYDDASGERTELSAKSLANWVAKTHHLLRDELGLGGGDVALITLPPHWISVPVVLGCLTAGLSLVTSGPADVAFVVPPTSTVAADTYAIALDSAAAGFGDAVPPGTLDYVGAVRPQADAWGSVQFGATRDDPCFGGRSRGEVADLAIERAHALGFDRMARVLTTRPWTDPDDWVDTLLAPLAAGGSVVYVANAAGEESVQRRIAQERVTNRV